ncbi:MAG: type II secretion system protein GspD [Betaproteobacteria bacterium RIFCSPLOWO2_12_FULL_63_13]|nr:MAG: type II secretion system protein GspD [Betaproteobacteria bacterium RIFCSPLOWO2_12_FULL_63_13]
MKMRTKLLLRTGLTMLASVLIAVEPAGAADKNANLQPVGSAEERVTLNFVNAEIESVIKAVSQITGKNFLLDPRVKGTINVVSGKPVPSSLAYPLLLSALRMQGFAAVEYNDVTKIIPEVEAKTQAGPTRSGTGGPRGDQMLTKVFALQHESAVQMVPVLRPLIAPNNSISAYANNNTLVITDYADNLARLERIIAALDTPFGEGPRVIPIRHASAIDLANMLGRLYPEGPRTGNDTSQRVTILADSRANSLIVSSDNPGKIARILALIDRLDQPTAAAGNIHVVYLKNADAANVARTLRAIVTGEAASPLPSTPIRGASTTSATAGTAGSAATARGTQAVTRQNTSIGLADSLASGGFIQADIANNALIITAPEPVYNNLRSVIAMLDKRRAQVYIEALIVDLQSDRASEFGIQWQDLTGTGPSGARIVGGTNFSSGGSNIIGLIENVAKASTAGSLGISPGLNVGVIFGKTGGGVPNLGVLARFLETNAKANILSTPNILTLDNEEATIIVGSNVPFITGQYAQTGASLTASPFQTYDRRDVGLTLRIRPQISEGGIVRMQLFHEQSSIQGTTLSNPAGPITTKRSIESSVVVDDGGIVVIGGLIEDNWAMGEDKVPVLGDIPVLGAMFRYETRKRTRNNLMVFLRPRIIRDATTYQGLTADRYDYVIGEQQKNAEGTTPMPGEPPAPTLPARAPSAPASGEARQPAAR